jgi:hypothetical protein
VANETPALSWVLHDTLLQVLKRLNQATQRDEHIQELEFAELERAMARSGAAASWTNVDVSYALQLLLENGLAESVNQPVYAWDRQRVLGERFRITTLGKAYLMRQISESGRIR